MHRVSSTLLCLLHRCDLWSVTVSAGSRISEQIKITFWRAVLFWLYLLVWTCFFPPQFFSWQQISGEASQKIRNGGLNNYIYKDDYNGLLRDTCKEISVSLSASVGGATAWMCMKVCPYRCSFQCSLTSCLCSTLTCRPPCLSTCLCLCVVNEGGVRQASNSCPDPGEPENGKRHGSDFRYSSTILKHTHAQLYVFCTCLTSSLSPLHLCCVASAVQFSSVVEKTTSSKAVKPSAAREWRKSSQPGVTTDRSAKVRKGSAHTHSRDTGGRGGSHRCEGRKPLKHSCPWTLPQIDASGFRLGLFSLVVSLCWSRLSL